MQDRCEIKWQPFNSVINSKTIINEFNKKLSKMNKPILSEDQLENLNNLIFDSYINHIKIYLFIYKNNNILKLSGYINNINKNSKYITFNNVHIYFNQILKISEI